MLKTVSTQLALASDTLSEILGKGNTSGPSNIVMDAGYGIDFSATAGTGTSELLDDYEEGTWTPVVRDAAAGNAATAVAVVGIYTKVGRTVTFELTMTNVTTAGLTAGNGIYITGLPYAKYNDGNMFGSYPVQRNAFSSTDGMLTASIVGGTSYMRIFNELVSTAGTANALVSQISSGSAEINICGIYQTN